MLLLSVLGIVAVGIYLVSTHDVAFLEYLQARARSNVVGAMFTFATIHLLVVVLGLPGTTVLALAAGYLFGFLPGAVLVLVVTVAGSAITFAWAARLAERHAGRMERWPLVGHIRRLLATDPVHYLLLLRIVPVFPLFAVNVALALVHTGWPAFLLTTTAGLAASLSIYAGLGSGLGDILAVREQGLLDLVARPGFWIPVAALTALIGASMVLRWRLRRRVETRRRAGV